MVIGIKVDQRLSTTRSPNLGSVINSLNWKERLTKLNKFVCLFVSLGQKNIAGKDTNRDTFSMLLEVGRCRELESEVYSPRNPIIRLGTDENRDRRKHLLLRYLDAGNTNPAPKHVENPLVDREPIEIEFAGKLFHILHWKNNLRPVFTSHIGVGLEKVDTSVNTTSREWRPRGAPTND